MAAYVIITRESPFRDEEAYAEYRRTSGQARGDFKMKPVVVYGALEPLEGKPPEGVVMLEFPTVAEAKAWYESPAYQAALKHRLRSADWRAVIVEGLG